MFRVGITGGIGSGKTTVCKIFEILGIPVFYADDVAKLIMITNSNLIEAIKENFGKDSYSPKGEINRKYIANQVFNDPKKLEKLNNLVHPQVFKEMDLWSSNQKSPYVLKEAALLFESKSYLQNNANVLITSPFDLRFLRLIKRDNTTKEKIQERMDTQLSETEKQKLANYTVNNNELDFLIPQILNLHQIFLQKSKQYNY
ncbi:dephospho-CoA kinase [Pedobacter psychrophilus]|uniref:Dephospho-CoA kinase n=1 Tax=Pedobacter psychrophilus TaxID=1826909 RepID=A0A179DNV3_9SPHI|nr:dephospho-CoA kinase [Pedobacter psychrophilus]OAQ42203.1 dephospho-CoA kinase [Pedobacter psychrophilus]